MPREAKPESKDTRHLPSSEKRRKRWERRYGQKQGADFIWFLDQPPPELVQLVERNELPIGAALDLGCGPGVATAYMARHFNPAVGMDIALAAVIQAQQRARREGLNPRFVVAEAPVLPFRSASFSLVFDRGCLQAIPKDAWPTYFREVERLLVPGGMFQLFCSKPMKQFPPLLSYRGVRARLRWVLGRRGPQFLSHSLLRELAEPSMHARTLEDFPFQPTAGPVRAMTHGIFVKSPVDQPSLGP
jgi:SAM-dependent methyltransferase